MLVLALDDENNIIHIKDSERSKDYHCPDCGEVVRCRKGDVNAHHYYHLCSECNSNGESLVHRYFKQKFAELKTIELDGVTYNVTHSEIEKSITSNLRVDVLLVLDGWKSIALEVCYKHAKDEEHIKMFRELGLEAYEIYVDMNEEQTDFEIIGWQCLCGVKHYNLEIDKLKQEVEASERECEMLENEIKKMDSEICTLKKQAKIHMAEVEELKVKIANKNRERRVQASQEVEKTIREVTGFTYRELQSCYHNTKTGGKQYLLEMMMILESVISNEVKIIQFNWIKDRRVMSDDRIFTITFLDWKKNHVADSIHNIKCNVHDFNLLAKLITEIYGVRVYKNENGKY